VARAARVLGVNVARFGDDASVIFPCQGLVAFAPQRFRNIDGTQGAGAVARKWQEWGADAVFIDDTGG
jgi:phage terminase large subunit